ncbi:MAG: helix-turn-helix transcriptional regulator, partial [Muriicola sp.]
MVNSEEFVHRLEKILSFYNLSASSFADKIGVQRSSISHLLTGRNKQSLEFVMKVVKSYP